MKLLQLYVLNISKTLQHLRMFTTRINKFVQYFRTFTSPIVSGCIDQYLKPCTFNTSMQIYFFKLFEMKLEKYTHALYLLKNPK